MKRKESNGTSTNNNETDSLSEIKRIEQKRKDVSKINLLNSPFLIIYSFLIATLLYIWESFVYLRNHTKFLIFFMFVVEHSLVFMFTPGWHQQYVQIVKDNAMIGGWWLLLGVLSSIGLGTGLHTFVLYLGPFIAKVTLAASVCNSVNFSKYGEGSFICPPSSALVGGPQVTLWQILRMVQLEALLWGAGTAIGELPPYFVARAARKAGQRAAELDEIEQELNNSDSSSQKESAISALLNKVKKLMFSMMGNLGFFQILLFASIPNPLFDLAGITCGHFLVPFWRFFGATLIGKAVIKAHFQTIFVIVMFSEHLMQYWIDLIETLLPFMTKFIEEFMQKQKAAFHRPSDSPVPAENKSILSMLWDGLLIMMLIYFLLSIVNSTARNYLEQKYESQIAQLKSKVPQEDSKNK